MDVYEPADDSFLLAEAVKKFAKGRVMDMGTGSGIQANTAAKSSKVKSVTATDINKNCGKSLSKGVKFIRSNLFSNVPTQKFDTIIFNPPYLPQDKGIRDATIYGGKKGHETVGRFLGSCSSYLSENGIVLLLFSSLTGKREVDELVGKNCLEKEEAARKNLPLLETLFVYRIRKSELLKQLEKRKISAVKLFAKGKRGVVYTGKLRGKKIAIKAQRKDTAAANAIRNEIMWLKKLKKHNTGPELIGSGGSYFIYPFVEGLYLADFVRRRSKEKTAAVAKKVLLQCRRLDMLKVNKEEMLRPHKHVIVRGSNVTMLDFERCHKSARPKNVTQFCQFLAGAFRNKRQPILKAARNYKKNPSEHNFKALLSLI